MTTAQDLLSGLSDEEAVRLAGIAILSLEKIQSVEGRLPDKDHRLLRKLIEIRYLLNRRGIF